MSDREYRRSEVVGRVLRGELRVVDAASLLGVSYRQAKRLVKRMRENGRRGLLHGNVGRKSNRSHPASERKRILSIVREHYGGSAEGAGQRFGPTLAAEHLFTDHGILVAVPTLRRWMLGEGLWSRVRRTKRRFRRRVRREHFGELVQLDGSFHDWFETRGPRGCLITMIDDATGRALGRMNKEETTWDAAAVLRAWVELHGVPKALYVDGKNVFVRDATVNELARGVKPVTQFGRMCAKLGIELIVAGSPQAKGRIERNHGVNQDRLIKKMRLKAICDYETANAYLTAEYFPAHNQRFAVAPEKPLDFHTRLNPHLDLEHVFCLEEERVVSNDWIVQYDGRALQIEPSRRSKRLTGPRARVLVRETATGKLLIVSVAPAGDEHELEWRLAEAPRSNPQRYTKPRVSTPKPTPAVVPAGYTRSGKPLSAQQMAVRAKWDREDRPGIEAGLRRRSLGPAESVS